MQLDDFPALKAWYLALPKMETGSGAASPVSLHLKAICEVLNSQDKQLFVERFFVLISKLQKSDSLTNEVYNILQDNLQKFQFSLSDFFRVSIEHAAEIDVLSPNLNELVKFSEKANHPVVHFLVAWAALNCNQFDVCTDQCERIDDPTAAAYTLQGQAYLESGYTKDAIECLEIANELLPGDVLNNFQLAKAYHLQKQYAKAWHSMQVCQEHAGYHLEITTMFAIIALSERTNTEWLRYSWTLLSQNLIRDANNHSLVSMLLDIAFLLEDKASVKFVIEHMNSEKLKNDVAFIKKVPWILRNFEKLKWTDCSVLFLEKTAAPQAV